MESQLRHTQDAIAQKKKNMGAIQQEIEMQVRCCGSSLAAGARPAAGAAWRRGGMLPLLQPLLRVLPLLQL